MFKDEFAYQPSTMKFDQWVNAFNLKTREWIGRMASRKMRVQVFLRYEEVWYNRVEG